jgi:hypothetical protein
MIDSREYTVYKHTNIINKHKLISYISYKWGGEPKVILQREQTLSEYALTGFACS